MIGLVGIFLYQITSIAQWKLSYDPARFVMYFKHPEKAEGEPLVEITCNDVVDDIAILGLYHQALDVYMCGVKKESIAASLVDDNVEDADNEEDISGAHRFTDSEYEQSEDEEVDEKVTMTDIDNEVEESEGYMASQVQNNMNSVLENEGDVPNVGSTSQRETRGNHSGVGLGVNEEDIRVDKDKHMNDSDHSFSPGDDSDEELGDVRRRKRQTVDKLHKFKRFHAATDMEDPKFE